ncbi:hypothetical protein ATCVCanal1_248L [Acanthocystis turfacea Chlorella virus Canal-1]|nr:hypothetical protein ATCVCanal1_248L [Acanthocystis turfacea Chlorella virus Canal-1]
MTTKASSAETANIGENALARFAKGPFDSFKEDAEFSPVDGIVEEILGRLGCLRRNQIIVDASAGSAGNVDLVQNSVKLLRDYGMRVIHITETPMDTSDFYFKLETEFTNGASVEEILKKKNVPKEFPLLVIDTSTINIPYSPLVVVTTVAPSVDPWQEGKDGFKETTAFWESKGYCCVAMAEKFLVFMRTELSAKVGVKNVVLRNPQMIFDWKAHKKPVGFLTYGS